LTTAVSQLQASTQRKIALIQKKKTGIDKVEEKYINNIILVLLQVLLTDIIMSVTENNPLLKISVYCQTTFEAETHLATGLTSAR
jgi:hypothetical protein